jgi:fatty-acyl-CoA synthase
VFLRFMPAIEATSTFKQRKLNLVKEGFDPQATADPLFFFHPELQAYVRLTPSLHDDIAEGSVRL